MKSILHKIESNNLFGLADNYNIEIVECVYDRIRPLTNGKYIVVKDKMAGILNSYGKIILYPQPNRLHVIEQLDIFHYKVDGGKVYFTFLKDKIYYLSVDKLKYDEKLQIINVWKNGELKVYNCNFSQIETGFEQIEQTDLKQGNSRFYLGKKNGMWGVFRIKRPPKREPEIITTLETIFSDSEEALLALKRTRHNTGRRYHRGTNNIITGNSKK